MIKLLFIGYVFYIMLYSALSQIGILFALCQMTVKKYKIMMTHTRKEFKKEVVISLKQDGY